jgi:hypothetical protein
VLADRRPVPGARWVVGPSDDRGARGALGPQVGFRPLDVVQSSARSRPSSRCGLHGLTDRPTDATADTHATRDVLRAPKWHTAGSDLWIRISCQSRGRERREKGAAGDVCLGVLS